MKTKSKIIARLVFLVFLFSSCSATNMIHSNYDFYQHDCINVEHIQLEHENAIIRIANDTLYRIQPSNAIKQGFIDYYTWSRYRKKRVRKGETLNIDNIYAINRSKNLKQVVINRNCHVPKINITIDPTGRYRQKQNIVIPERGGGDNPNFLFDILTLTRINHGNRTLAGHEPAIVGIDWQNRLWETYGYENYRSEKVKRFIWFGFNYNDTQRRTLIINGKNTYTDTLFFNTRYIKRERIPGGLLVPNPFMEFVLDDTKYNFYDIHSLFLANTNRIKRIKVDVLDLNTHIPIKEANIEIQYDNFSDRYRMSFFLNDWAINSLPDYCNYSNRYYPVYGSYPEFVGRRIRGLQNLGNLFYVNLEGLTLYQHAIENGESFNLISNIITPNGSKNIPVEKVKIKVTSPGYHYFEEEIKVSDLLKSEGRINIFLSDVGQRIRVSEDSGSNYLRLE